MHELCFFSSPQSNPFSIKWGKMKFIQNRHFALLETTKLHPTNATFDIAALSIATPLSLSVHSPPCITCTFLSLIPCFLPSTVPPSLL